MTTTKTQTQIQQAAICRCTDKNSKEVFYAVKSDSSDAWYQVRFDNSRLAWSCGCPSVKPCKHERAVQEVLKARKAQADAEKRAQAPLHNNRQGFSLMR